ncbi:MAG TPA: ATP-grasp domain-containing protein [Flavobacteriia bacterium]|nr:ATP-grasp domain-containing protein [Flavobacteriia bacterium]
MHSKKDITIAVTGLNAIDSPGPGIAVIRGLRESTFYNVRIIGLAYEILEPGIYMDGMVDKVYQIPYPSSGFDAMLERFTYIQGNEKIDVVIPNFDAELMTFIKLKPHFNKMGIHLLIPTKEQFEDRLKGNLNAFGEKHQINVPKSETVYHINELEEALEGFEYPVVIKGKFYDAYIAASSEQAREFYFKVSAKWGVPIIIQEFIKGNEFNVTALGDGKGTLMGAVPMRKTFLTDKGKAWAGISINDPNLIKMADEVISKTQWAGGLELELMKEDKTNKLYLLEINPRFPAWVYLANGCGQNHPEMLVKLAMGEKVAPYKKYDVGKMFIRYSYDMICDLDKYEKISIHGEV